MYAYANGTGNTLIHLDVLLAILHLGGSTVVNELHTHILLAATQLRSIDGDEEGLDATLLSMLNVFLGDLAVTVDVSMCKVLSGCLKSCKLLTTRTVGGKVVGRGRQHRQFRQRSKMPRWGSDATMLATKQ